MRQTDIFDKGVNPTRYERFYIPGKNNKKRNTPFRLWVKDDQTTRNIPRVGILQARLGHQGF